MTDDPADAARGHLSAARFGIHEAGESDWIPLATADALTGIGYALLAIHAELRELNGAAAVIAEAGTVG